MFAPLAVPKIGLSWVWVAMADMHCVKCGVLLGRLDTLRGYSECASCRGVDDKLAHGVATTAVAVMGLANGTGVASFRRTLGQMPGVKDVAVRNCSSGVYEFTVHHDPSTPLSSLIQETPDFIVRITRGAAPDWIPGEPMTVMVSGSRIH